MERLGAKKSPIVGEDIVVSIVPERSLVKQKLPVKIPDMPLPILPMDFFDPEEKDFQRPLFDFPLKPLSSDELQTRIESYGTDDTKFR